MRSASTPRRSMFPASGNPPRRDAEFGWLAANRIAADEAHRAVLAAVEQERLLAEAGLARRQGAPAARLAEAMVWLRTRIGATRLRAAIRRPKPSRLPLA